MLDKEDDDEDVQDTVWRIKDSAREAAESAHSAINEARSEVQALIDENDESDEEGAVQDAVEELSTFVAGLEAAADEVEHALRAVSLIGIKAKANDAEDEGGNENDKEDDEPKLPKP
jgi:exonuclease VII small subunit